MTLWRRLTGAYRPPERPARFTTSREPAKSAQEPERELLPPSWDPPDTDARRLVAFARKVAGELEAAGKPLRREGMWVVSFDVHEAVWHPAQRGSHAQQRGQVRDGWAQGNALLLFPTGALGRSDFFGEVDLSGAFISFEPATSLQGCENHRWAGGNLGRWRPGGGGLNSDATEHFKGRWYPPRTPLPPWAGTSSQLARLRKGESPAPRYY